MVATATSSPCGAPSPRAFFYAAAVPLHLALLTGEIGTDRKGRLRAQHVTYRIPWGDITYWTRDPDTQHPPPASNYPTDAVRLTLPMHLTGSPILTFVEGADDWEELLTTTGVPRSPNTAG